VQKEGKWFFAYQTGGRGIERNRIGIGIGIFENEIEVGKMGIRAEEREKKIGVVVMECGGRASVTRRRVARSCSFASINNHQ